MGNSRMLDKNIIDSDLFMELPHSAKIIIFISMAMLMKLSLLAQKSDADLRKIIGHKTPSITDHWHSPDSVDTLFR